MRRWMAIITVSALVIALVAGWGIGQLAGGGSGGSDLVVRALPTLEPTSTPAAEPTVPSRSTPATVGTPLNAAGTPVNGTPPAAIQRPTSIPDVP